MYVDIVNVVDVGCDVAMVVVDVRGVVVVTVVVVGAAVRRTSTPVTDR